MKRLFALLLALCLMVGLVACTPAGGPTDDTGNNTTNNNGGDAGSDKPYAGKTLQIWGLGSADAASIDNLKKMGKGSYLYMMRAAIYEWAALNDVTVEFVANYDSSALLADINSGKKPDLIYSQNTFPGICNLNLLHAYTEEEYNKLAEVVDSRYLDLMTYKGKSYGWIVPWTGDTMVYYNKSMFERYGVKTPTEYVMEGNWTWTAFTKCMEEMTRDLDGDGINDTYGLNSDSAPALMNPQWTEDENGKLTTETIDSQIGLDYVTWKYTNQVLKGYIVAAPSKIQTQVTYPMSAMQCSDAEPYNFEHCFQTIRNGDVLEVVPLPAYDGEDKNAFTTRRLTNCNFSTLSSCDELEAALDLQIYMLKCGQKYVSDFSLGAVKCDYEGISGASEYSKQWKEQFEQICEDRKADFEDVEFNQDLVDKYYEFFDSCEAWSMYKSYTGVSPWYANKAFLEAAPASAMPVAKAAYVAAIKKYNDLYVPE